MKKNIFIIVLALLVVGLGGFITYDNFFKPSTKCETKIETKKVTKEKTADERYKEYLKNLTKTVEDSTDSQDVTVKTLNDITYFISINNKKELSIGYDTNEMNKINKKEADDVIDFFTAYVGNGGYISLYYLTSKGELYVTTLDEYLGKEKFEFKKVEKNNIVSVKPVLSIEENGIGGYTVRFIDIDGNEVK